MKNQQPVPTFELSRLAKAGVHIMNLQDWKGKGEHDISTPHRDDHYLFMMATQGRLKVYLDFEESVFSAPAILFVFPGQVHYILEVQEVHGWTISFDPSLIDLDFQHALEKRFNGPLQLNQQTAFYHRVATLMDLLEKLQSDAPNVYVSKSSHALLIAILSIIEGEMEAVPSERKAKDKRGDIIENEFRLLLKQYYKTWKQPALYAAELAISVSHLNDTVKELTGNSVSTHIQQYAVLEAKRLLYFTNLSVKEIGYELGYDEPVYFGKLFKKVTSFTPLQFRQKFRYRILDAKD